jgi:hypothetical protein
MIHAYYDFNLGVVWQTIKSDLPDLLISIEKILKWQPNSIFSFLGLTRSLSLRATEVII